MHSRRNFLRGGTAALAAGVASPAIAKIAPADFRAVAFNNLHTGEKLKIDYWVEGRYVPDALKEIDHRAARLSQRRGSQIDPKLLDLLNHCIAGWAATRPFEVISGYRSPATNAMLHAPQPRRRHAQPAHEGHGDRYPPAGPQSRRICTKPRWRCARAAWAIIPNPTSCMSMSAGCAAGAVRPAAPSLRQPAPPVERVGAGGGNMKV